MNLLRISDCFILKQTILNHSQSQLRSQTNVSIQWIIPTGWYPIFNESNIRLINWYLAVQGYICCFWAFNLCGTSDEFQSLRYYMWSFLMVERIGPTVFMRLPFLGGVTWPDAWPRWGPTRLTASLPGRSHADVFQTEQNLVEQVQGLVHEEVHEVGRRLAPHSRINDLKTHSWWIIDSSPEDG